MTMMMLMMTMLLMTREDDDDNEDGKTTTPNTAINKVTDLKRGERGKMERGHNNQWHKKQQLQKQSTMIVTEMVTDTKNKIVIYPDHILKQWSFLKITFHFYVCILHPKM